MKHPSTRAFLACWDEKRAGARAPNLSEIEPGAVRELLGDIFVLSDEAAAGYPFRVAGTRVCALLGGDLKDRSFSAMFGADSRREIEEIIAVVAEEMQPAVVSVTATSQDGSPALLELLLLPFSAGAHAPVSLTGLLAPFKSGHGPLHDFKLTSWRYLGEPQQKLVPRALRKLKIAQGFMRYEGSHALGTPIEVASDDTKTGGMGLIGAQPIALAAGALILILLGVGATGLSRAYTGASPEQDRTVAVRQLQVRAAQASEQLAEKTKGLEATQQESIDQLQLVQEQLQTVKRLLAAQQTDHKRLSEQVSGLTGPIDGLRQSFASAPGPEASRPSASRNKSVRSRTYAHRGGHRRSAKSRRY